MQGQSISVTRLSEKSFYPMIDSAQAAAPNRTQDEAYVAFPKWLFTTD